MLEPKNIEIVLADGVDQKTGLLVRKPGTLRTAENVEFDKGGALNKRRGYERIPLDAATNNGSFAPELSMLNVCVHDGSLVIYGTQHIYHVISPDDQANDAAIAVRGPTLRGAFHTFHVTTGGYGTE